MVRSRRPADMLMESPFPIEGLDLERSHIRQRQGTTIEAVNVMSFQDDLRSIGGSRSGFRKWSTAQVNSNYPIQNISHLQSTILAPAATTTGYFLYSQGSGNGFGLANKSSGASVFSGIAAVSGYAFACSCWGDDNESYVAEVNTTTGGVNIYRINSGGSVEWTVSSLSVATGSLRAFAGMVQIDKYLYVAIRGSASSIVQIDKATGAIAANPWRAGASFLNFSTGSVNCLGKCGKWLGVDVCGSTGQNGFQIYDGTGGPAPSGTFAGNGSVGYGTTASNNPTKVCSDGVNAFYVLASTSTGQIKRINLAAGIEWSSTAADSANSLTYNHSDASLVVLCQTAPCIRKITLAGGTDTTPSQGATIWNEIDCDGKGAYVVWQNGVASNDVQGLGSALGSEWGPSTLANATHSGATVNKGVNQAPTNSDTNPRGIRMIAIAGGVIKRMTTTESIAPTGGSVSLSTTAKQISTAQFGLNLYVVDGNSYTYYRNADDKHLAWAATTGTIPTDSPVPSCANGIENAMGRLFIFRFSQQPHLYAACAVGNAFDWDSSPDTVTSTTAILGSVDGYGFPGQTLNAIVPYTDDTAIFGAANKLWMLRGDPQNGGKFDVVDHTIGMPPGRPWCIGGNGIIYFLSSQGDIYKIIPGSQPTILSGKISHRLQTVNLATKVVSLAWDVNKRRLHIWLTQASGGAATHYCWQEKVDGWVEIVYKNKKHNPFCAYVFDGDEPNDRAIALGGQDGYIRMLADGTDDDGYEIESSVVFGPFVTPNLDELLIKDILTTFLEESGDVEWEFRVGRTAQLALESEPVRTGKWKASRNRVSPIYRSGRVCYLKITSKDYWAIEKVLLKVRQLGATRGRAYA